MHNPGSRKSYVSTLIRSGMFALVIAVTSTMVGCSSGGGGGNVAIIDPPTSVIGSWSGNVVSTSAGNGIFTIDLFEPVVRDSLDNIAAARGAYSVSGTWNIDYAGEEFDESGDFSELSFTGTEEAGELSGTMVSYFFGECDANFEASWSGFNLSGTFDSVLCRLNGDAEFGLTYIPENQIHYIDGNYYGTVTSEIGGLGELELELSQSGSNFTGNMFMDFLGEEFDIFGFVFGTISGETIEWKFYPFSIEFCSYTVTGTLDGLTFDSITGSLNTIFCLDEESDMGEFVISKPDLNEF